MSVPFKLLLVGFMALGFYACESDNLSTVSVDEELQPWFDLFVEEGAQRGVHVDLSGITGIIENITSPNVAGSCSISGNNKTVRLDLRFWSAYSLLEKELVVFHELGHCYLERGHLETADVRGVCQSMMNSGISNCRINYNLATRTTYLDELFDE